MKKIGIVTINDNNNYGNRLQNYAVQTVIQKIGHEPYTLENYSRTNTKKHYLLRKLKYWKFNKNYSINEKRRQNFMAFNSGIIYDEKLFNVFSRYDQYDYLIVGSDQVWNPRFGISDATLLTSIPPQKRVAYAASFGVDTIDSDTCDSIKADLLKFKAISMRESTGSKIVKMITNNTPITVVDPTLMLSSDEWEKLENKMDLPNSKYIFSYFLGGNPDSVKELSEKLQLPVYDVLDKTQTDIYSAGPAEFLYLIHHAEIVLTDSFHACVFSFIFNRPFVVFDRKNGSQMNTRIECFLDLFGLTRKHYSENIDFDFLEHDYTKGYEQLEVERKKAMNFLVKAIEE